MTAEATVRMDRMYRHQRHIYDRSRKFYLLGPDRLVRELEPGPGARICEIGCGTGRNLVALARRHPDAEIFGLDASNAILKTARATIARADRGRAVERAIGVLKPAGLMAIVDFSEQRDLPAGFRGLLRRWLTLFDVTQRAGLPDRLRGIAERERGALTVVPLYRDYACLLRYCRPAAP